ncbi:hypothetical protein B4100_1647 [Heyndrickxia coagulans]|nr:hypothetical protein B4100_1647 [Heyndrickxia coagulans]
MTFTKKTDSSALKKANSFQPHYRRAARGKGFYEKKRILPL